MDIQHRSHSFKRAASLIAIVLMLAALGMYLPVAQAHAYSGFPTFSILSVVANTSVTIQTTNLPPNQTFTVRMGVIGTRGIGGTIVATTDSGAGGSQKLTYNIPAGLKGSAMIAIRMDSPQGYFAYNWFINSTTGTVTPTVTPGGPTKTPSPTAFSGIPTFSIVSVVKDTSVTVKTNNYPAGKTFTVRMGAFGTRGISGEIVGTKDSGTGGAFEATFNIPTSLKGSARIAIRMDAPGGFFAYNWFFNNSTAAPTGVTATPGGPTATPKPIYTGIPTFSISAVVKDTSVTIKTNNFPAGKTFTVRMGAFGTQGIGGVVVGTKDSGTGGAFEATFNIPDSLKGSTRIAIRLDSPGGFFAYNWFFNSTYP